MSEGQKIIEKLKEVIDPELGYDIVSLGMIEEVKIEKNKVFIKFLPTSLFCPYLPFLIEIMETKIRELGYKDIEINVDFENVWSIDRASEEIKKNFNL